MLPEWSVSVDTASVVTTGPVHPSSTATHSECRRELRSTGEMKAPGVKQKYPRHGATAR
jgi:hypothetical protein